MDTDLLDSYFEPILLSKLHNSSSSFSCCVCGIKYLKKWGDNLRLHHVKLILKSILPGHFRGLTATCPPSTLRYCRTSLSADMAHRLQQEGKKRCFPHNSVYIYMHSVRDRTAKNSRKFTGSCPRQGPPLFWETGSLSIKSGHPRNRVQTHRLIFTPSSLSERKNSKDL